MVRIVAEDFAPMVPLPVAEELCLLLCSVQEEKSEVTLNRVNNCVLCVKKMCSRLPYL